MAARQYLSLAFLKVGCAAASAMLVGIGICHIGALYKKARTKAGNGNVVEGLLGLVSASIVEVGGRVVLALAPVHLDLVVPHKTGKCQTQNHLEANP